MNTERLLLREWLPGDLEPFASLNGDPRVMEHFPGLLTRAQSDAVAQRIGAELQQRGWGLWAVEHDDAFIGFVGLTPAPEQTPFSPAVEVGWRLAHHAWGHGFATEAARAALRFAFETLELDRVVSFTAPANVRSRAVMERLGMEQGEDFEHPALAPGHRLRRHVLYRISAAQHERGEQRGGGESA